MQQSFYIIQKQHTGVRDHTIPSIRTAFDHGKIIHTVSQYGSKPNISDIQSRLIRETGTLAENYASDLVYNLQTIDEVIDEMLNQPAIDPICPEMSGGNISCVLCTGIRRNGVDGDSFLKSRLPDTIDPMSGYVMADRTYRKIFGVEITRWTNTHGNREHFVKITVQLRDLTHAFSRWAYEDLPEDKQKTFANIRANFILPPSKPVVSLEKLTDRQYRAEFHERAYGLYLKYLFSLSNQTLLDFAKQVIKSAGTSGSVTVQNIHECLAINTSFDEFMDMVYVDEETMEVCLPDSEYRIYDELLAHELKYSLLDKNERL